MANLFFVIVVAVIAIILLVIRTNASIVFLALCAGSVLDEFATKNIANINGKLDNTVLPKYFTLRQTSVELAILLIPPILVAIIMKHGKGGHKFGFQIIPAIATGLVGLLLALPYLSYSFQKSLTKGQAWTLIEQYQVLIVAVSIVAVLIMVVMSSYLRISSSKHHKV